MWRNMLARCGSNKPKNKAYKNIEVRMTRDEWNNWAIPAVQEFMDLHPDKVPSIDRKDKNKHYELGNLRIIDFLENSKLSTARIESAFSKMAELYGSCSCEEKQQVLDEFVSRAKESLGMR